MLWKYSISSEINMLKSFKMIIGFFFLCVRSYWIDVYPCLTTFSASLPAWWNGTALQGLLRVDWWLNGPGSGGNVNHFQPVNIWYVTVREPLGLLVSPVSGTTRSSSALPHKWYECTTSVNPHVKFGSRRVWTLQGLKSAKPHFHA